MPDKIVAVIEHALYEASFILKEVGIDKINPKATYTFTNKSNYVAGGSLTFVYNGRVRHNEDTILVKGSDFYRFTIQAAQSRHHYKNTPMVVEEKINGVVQKTYKFTVSSKERVLVKGNQAPAITVKNKLSHGDNKASDIISYKDPENHPIQNIAVDLGWRPEKSSNLKLVFDGTEIKERGLFSFTPQQLQWLKFRVPQQGPFSDEVYTSITDIHGGRSESKATAFLVGK